MSSRPSSSNASALDPVARTGTTLLALSSFELESYFPAGCDQDAVLGPCVIHNPVDTARSWREVVANTGPDLIVTGWSTPAIPPELTAPHGGTVRYVCHVSGSIRHVISRDLVSDGLWVTNWGRLVAPIVAEHALLLTLSALRNQSLWARQLRQPREYPKASLRTRTLHGKRVAIHGLGAIGQALVPLLRPFGVTLSAYSRGLSPEFIRRAGARPAASLIDLARDADIFISCESLTPQTRGELNRDILAALPAEAVFVNVGRGALVDEAALAEAARSGRLRVASDVFCEEPLPRDSPLLHIEGVQLSPHIGGPTHDFYPRCGEHARENIARFRRGEEPLGLFDPDTYDRST